MKKVLGAVLTCVMLLSSQPAFAEERISVFVNGEKNAWNAIAKDGEIYIPVRAFAEVLQCSVEWDSDKKSVAAEGRNIQAEIPVGKEMYKKDGLKYTMKHSACLIGDSAYMPTEALTVFNAAYEYDENSKTLEITSSVLDGKYVTVKQGGKVLGVEGEKSENKGKISLGEKKDDGCVWLFEARGSNVYRMVNRESGKAIDVSSSSKNAGVVLATYAKNGGNNQKFVPEKCDGGYFLQCFDSKLLMRETERTFQRMRK